MPIIHSHDLKKFQSNKILSKEGQGLSYKQPYVQGGFIGDLVKAGVEFAKNNPEIIKGAITTVGNIKNMATDISKAVESSNKLKELQALREISKTNAEISKANKESLPPETSEKIRQLAVKGNGFKLF